MSVEKTRKGLVDFFVLVDTVVVGFANIMDRAKVGRKAMLYFTLYLTYRSYEFTTTFIASHADKSGIELGAITAAVLLPIGLLQKAVFESYITSTQAIQDDAPAAPGAVVKKMTASSTESIQGT